MKQITVIDGQGGGLGRQLVSEIKKAFPELPLTAVGVNSIATAAMRKAGADQCATGENAVLVAARNSGIILGPIGVVIADALLGEITPAMAVAVGQSPARKILLPMDQCCVRVAGVTETAFGQLVAKAVEALGQLLAEEA